jgi:hypothetical protein
MRKSVLLLTIAFGLSIYCNAQTTEVKAKGIYKEIDLARHNKAIEILNGKNKKSKQKTIDSILSKPNYYNPPVLYALSRELYNQDQKDKAKFWFYTAQLRARYDANLCLDNSAKQAVSVLNNEYGPDINKYAFQNLDSLEKTVTMVVDFVRNNEEDFDHRWISLHGMGAVMSGMGNDSGKKEVIQPQDKWADIKKKTIDDYLNGFIEYVKKQKK